jgi:hypothetical protein
LPVKSFLGLEVVQDQAIADATLFGDGRQGGAGKAGLALFPCPYPACLKPFSLLSALLSIAHYNQPKNLSENSGGVRILSVQAHSKCGSSIIFG